MILFAGGIFSADILCTWTYHKPRMCVNRNRDQPWSYRYCEITLSCTARVRAQLTFRVGGIWELADLRYTLRRQGGVTRIEGRQSRVAATSGFASTGTIYAQAPSVVDLSVCPRSQTRWAASMIETNSPGTGMMRWDSNAALPRRVFHSTALRSLPPVTANMFRSLIKRCSRSKST